MGLPARKQEYKTVISSIESATAEENRIDGVVFKPIVTHQDERGYFRELIRDNDDFFAGSFGQWSHSKMAKDTVKAWHFHHLQIDWWYLALGLAETALYDNRPESPTYKRLLVFRLGETELDSSVISAVVKIPQGVLHGLRVLSDTAHLFYVTSHIYDPQDEGRIPFNDPEILHYWGSEATIRVVERDRKLHVPPYKRSMCTP